jgi:hypothetical protein
MVQNCGVRLAIVLAVASLAAVQPPTADRRLFDAIQSSSEDGVARALTDGASLRARDTRGRTPIAVAAARLLRSARTDDDSLDEPERVLAALLQEAARRAGREHRHTIADAGCASIARSLVCWAAGESGVQAFGRSGGLLLDAKDGWYPSRVRATDADGDGRLDLAFEFTVGRGTGTSRVDSRIYMFDGQRFAPPIIALAYSYIDSSWLGRMKRGMEEFVVPTLTSEGRIRFRDSDHDGRADVAEAVERRWWGSQAERGARGKPVFDKGPAWASARLKREHGFGLGVVDERVVATWTRTGGSDAWTATPPAP